jgi:hypothetical protein
VLAAYPDGSIAALSLTRPGVVYLLQLAPEVSCTCPGVQHRSQCYHVAAAVKRFGGLPAVEAEPRRYVCCNCGAPWDEATGDVVNGLHGCRDLNACVQRQQAVRMAFGVGGRWL